MLTTRLLTQRSLTRIKQPLFHTACLKPSTRLLSTASFQFVADALTNIHTTYGISWVVLVPTVTIALRTIFTLPLSIYQRKRVVKQQELRKVVQGMTPVLKARLAAAKASEIRRSKEIEKRRAIEIESRSEDVKLNGKVTAVPTTKEQVFKDLKPEQIVLLSAKETRKRQKKLFKKNGVPMWKNVLLPVVQIPLWCTVSMGIRNLTDWKVDRATKEWFEDFRFHGIDLTAPLESYAITIPIILGVFSLLNVEYNGRMMVRKSTDLVGVKTYQDEYSGLAAGIRSILTVSRFGCIFMMGVASQSPVLLSLYWISSQLYSLIQNIILDWLWPYQR